MFVNDPITGEDVDIEATTSIVKGKFPVSKVLPDFTFDNIQDGDVKTQVKVESVSKVLIVNNVLNQIYAKGINTIKEA